jgi:hypothetical protein
MADISRSGPHDLILKDNKLYKQHLTILINEKKNQLKQLDVTLDKIKSVEVKKIELTKETLQKEIQELSAEVNKPRIIDAEIIKKGVKNG